MHEALSGSLNKAETQSVDRSFGNLDSSQFFKSLQLAKKEFVGAQEENQLHP